MVKYIQFSVPREICNQTDLLLMDMAQSYWWIPQNDSRTEKFGAYMSAERVNRFFKTLYGLLFTRNIDGIIAIDEVVHR